MSGQQSNGGSGIGFTGLLLVMFIALKLARVITRSWWWVLAPAWISAAITVPVYVAIVIYAWRSR